MLSAKSGSGYSYYAGLKANYRGIFDMVEGLDLDLRRPSENELSAAVSRSCTNPSDASEVENNVAHALALRTFATRHGIRATRRSFGDLAMPPHCFVSYWEDLLLQFDRKNHVFLLDPSFNDGLTPEGRRFVFSVQNAHIREISDLRDARFVIFQFEINSNGALEVRPHFDTGIDYLTTKQIEVMIDETYRIGDEILVARRKAA